MSKSSIIISWDKETDNSIYISVCGEVNDTPHFRETFFSLDKPCYIYDIGERETGCKNAGNSATIALLSNLIDVIRKSDKTGGRIITEQERNSKFPLTDLVVIRKFAQIAGITIDEQKFHSRIEFQEYFKRLLGK